jgi:hypothetical protein
MYIHNQGYLLIQCNSAKIRGELKKNVLLEEEIK